MKYTAIFLNCSQITLTNCCYAMIRKRLSRSRAALITAQNSTTQYTGWHSRNVHSSRTSLHSVSVPHTQSFQWCYHACSSSSTVILPWKETSDQVSVSDQSSCLRTQVKSWQQSQSAFTWSSQWEFCFALHRRRRLADQWPLKGHLTWHTTENFLQFTF